MIEAICQQCSAPCAHTYCDACATERQRHVSLALATSAWTYTADKAPAPSVPEPAPIPGGDLVTPRLLDWLAGFDWNGAALAADLVRARDAFGRAKYGQGLSLGDGRDTVEDLRQELGDALQYAMKARLEGVSEEALKDLQRLTVTLFLLLSTEEV